MIKKVMRQSALHRRRGLSSEEIEEKSDTMRAILFDLSLFKRARLVVFYVSLPEEVQTHRMIEDTHQMGKRVALPVVDWVNKKIIPFEIKDPRCRMVPGSFNIPEPAKCARYPVSLEEIDMVIVPGVAFDAGGRRLGFGGGFYDRFLDKLFPGVVSIALAFECQLKGEIPCEKHDITVDYIITEKRLICC